MDYFIYKSMIYLDFENFINEKLGIRDDVIILSDFLFDILKDNGKKKIVIKNNIPKVSFRISKITINFHSLDDVLAYFNEQYTKLTEDGIEISLTFNKDIILNKYLINHELSHLIDHEIKLSKRIKDLKDRVLSSKFSNIFNDRKFNNLCQMIYLSDDGEIKAYVHQAYEIFERSFNYMLKLGYDKNKIFETLLMETGIQKIYKDMINYNIYDDLKNVPNKLKIRFFNDLINIDKKIYNIKKSPNLSKIKLFFYIFFSKKNDLDLNDIMFKTQKHINDKGIIFRNKIHRLYGLF